MTAHSNKEPGERKTETFLRKLSVVLTAAILIVGVSACAHHKATEGQDYGQVRTEASSTQATSSDQVVGTAPAPANAQNVEGTTTPAVISGPAKVDSSGRAYTRRSVGSAGNASGTGLNTNVNIVPQKSASNVTVTQSPAVSTTETTTQTTVAEVQIGRASCRERVEIWVVAEEVKKKEMKKRRSSNSDDDKSSIVTVI